MSSLRWACGVWLALGGCKPEREPAAPPVAETSAAVVRESVTAPVAAPVALRDSDGDSLADDVDLCPEVPGPMRDGCPDPDDDKDGILARVDECMDAAEIFNGIADGDGCPDELPEDLRAVTGPVAGLEFKYNKWDLDPRSYAVLDRAVEVFNKYPEVRFAVDGHVDAKGSMKSRTRLSGKRADSVRRYLIINGVAAERVESRDLGEERPIADNKTAEGRKLNRRIEFTILAGSL